jgi:WD40 repeat protein
LTLGQLKYELNSHTAYVQCLEFLNGKYLISGSWANTIKVWDLQNGTLKYSFNSQNGGHIYRIYALKLIETENSTTFASGSADGVIKVWKGII